MERKKKQRESFSCKKTVKVWDVNVDNIVVSKLVKTKTNSKYVIGIKFDKVIRSLVLIMPEMSGYLLKLKIKLIN